MESRLTAEQREKLKACKTAEEAKALAEEEGIELTDEQLESIVGGVRIRGWVHPNPKIRSN